MSQPNAIKVLIVEDSPTQSEELRYVLEEHGYIISAAKNGKEAFEKMRKSKPDLVISDIVMPEMNGFALCCKIKNEEDFLGIPVILLTALSDTEDVLKGLECGADNFITKPYDKKYLIGRIQNVLSAAKIEKSSPTETVEILFGKEKYSIASKREHILDLLLSTYETAVMKNRELKIAQQELKMLNEQLEFKVKERTAELIKINEDLEAEVAERRKAEEALKKERQRLYGVLETLPVMICLLTTDYHIVFANRSFREKFGESGGRHCYEYCFGRAEPCEFCETYKVLETGKPHHWEVTFPDRSSIIDVYDFPFTDVDGSPLILEMDIDITERKRLESVAQAASLMDNIGYVFSGVRHEIGNPINTMKMILAVLKKNLNKFPAEKTMTYIENATAEIDKMEFLLKSLKNFNMFENLEPEKLEMISFLQKFMALVINDFNRKGIRIETSSPGEKIIAFADPRALQQVLLNLMTNAADALEEKVEPVIRLFIHQIKDTVLIKVEDNGRGIPEKNRRDLFKPFFTTKTKGTGLGLVMVKKMMTKMNGHIEIISEEGQGTAVNLFLPAYSDALHI